MRAILELELPYPPSVNRYYGHGRGRVYVRKAGREYRESARQALLEQAPHHEVISEHCHLVVSLLPRDRRRRDVDNCLKCLLDALTSAGVYADDSLVTGLQIYREREWDAAQEGMVDGVDPAGEGRIKITIYPERAFFEECRA